MNFFKKYKWILLAISFIFLLVFGIVLLFNQSLGENIVLIISGITILTFAGIRFVPLIRSLDNKYRVLLNAFEILINIVIGGLMIYFSTKSAEETKKIIGIYKYCVAGVVWFRGLVYFIEVSFMKEKAEPSKFIAHIGFISLGAALLVWKDFQVKNLVIILIILCFLGAAYSLVDSIIHYNHYRKLYIPERKKEKKEVEKEEEVQEEDSFPTHPNIPAEITEIDSNPQDYVS